MKKNLKKVISAVIALALSASTFATVSFAKSFTDVASTASYAEAVDVLSGLGIINGYEDGTFGPDKTIKRSEAAKIIVAMVNKIATAEGRMGATQFDDVAADHWASGFINVGVADKFINGKSAVRFDPDGEVKYNEIVKMIVSCLGYEEYAQFYGGYPNGYISIADSEGITKGCSMDGDAAATRAVVAQLVYNALKTPVIQNKGMQYSAAQGGFVPNIQKQDGEESTYFKSLLTEKFDAYFVEGKVTATKISDDSLDADEITFDVEKTENYDNEDIVFVGKDAVTIMGNALTVKVGETNAADYINTYANAIIMLNEDEEYVMISFVPSSKNKTVTLDAGLYDDEETLLSDIIESDKVKKDAFIRYFASEDASKSTKYKLSDKLGLYVNGASMTANEANIKKYVLENEVGTVELVDSYSIGSAADGVYDYMYVEYFGTAKVDSVSSKKIVFADYYGFKGATLTLDVEEEEDLVYHIYYNDEEIALTDVQKDDILSIKYDVTKGDSINDSLSFEIYVSRDTQEGKFSGKDDEDKEITLAGERYTFVKAYADMTSSLVMGNEYKILLDVFGRIYGYETVASTARYAIFDRVTTNSSWDSIGAGLYFQDGTYKSIEIDLSRVGMTEDKIYEAIYKSNSYTNANKKPIEDRVVAYKLSSSTGKIISLEFLPKTEGKAEFKTRTQAIGSVRMSDATKIIDAMDYVKETSPSYSDLSISSIASLTDGVEYTAYGFGTKNADNTFPLVVVTVGAGNYTDATALAVVTKAMNTTSLEDGTEGFALSLLYGEEEASYFVSDDVEVKLASGAKATVDADNCGDVLIKGDVIVFQVDGNNNIDAIDLVWRSAAFGDYKDTVKEALTTDYDALITIPAEAKVWTAAWEPNDSDLTTSIVYGVVVNKADNYFQLAQIGDAKKDADPEKDTSIAYVDADKKDQVYEGLYTALDTEVAKGKNAKSNGGTMDISVNSDTNVYVYDSSASKNAQFTVGKSAEIVKTNIPESHKIEAKDGTIIIPWDLKIDGKAVSAQNTVNLALAKVVDGMATEVLFILGED